MEKISYNISVQRTQQIEIQIDAKSENEAEKILSDYLDKLTPEEFEGLNWEALDDVELHVTEKIENEKEKLYGN